MSGTVRTTRLASPAGSRPVFEAGVERLELTAASYWEIELGFGKGRYLLRRAASDPERRFLGVEIVAEYFRIAADRSARRGLTNLELILGEAQYVLATLLPPAFAQALHVYFPDPWPKARHHKRRLFSPRSLDLLLRVLVPGGKLFFASDHLEYAATVRSTLCSHPRLSVRDRHQVWADGARTNYEAKYIEEGRPIVRLVAELEGGPGDRGLLHPAARDRVLVAWGEDSDEEE